MKQPAYLKRYFSFQGRELGCRLSWLCLNSYVLINSNLIKIINLKLSLIYNKSFVSNILSNFASKSFKSTLTLVVVLCSSFGFSSFFISSLVFSFSFFTLFFSSSFSFFISSSVLFFFLLFVVLQH